MQTAQNHISENHPVIFYDGTCGLCDKSVQFFIARDKKRIFRYAALQSDFARITLGNNITFDSFVFYDKGHAYYRSSGALKAFARLGGLFRLVLVFMLIPAFIRNAVYDWVARNRYRWFGKYDQCKIPSKEQRELFIDDAE